MNTDGTAALYCTLENRGTILIESGADLTNEGGKIENSGRIIVKSSLGSGEGENGPGGFKERLPWQPTFINRGSMEVSGTMGCSATEFTNYGTINITGTVKFQGCRIYNQKNITDPVIIIKAGAYLELLLASTINNNGGTISIRRGGNLFNMGIINNPELSSVDGGKESTINNGGRINNGDELVGGIINNKDKGIINNTGIISFKAKLGTSSNKGKGIINNAGNIFNYPIQGGEITENSIIGKSVSISESFSYPTCPLSGSDNATLGNIKEMGSCLSTPDKYEIIIYEMGLYKDEKNPLYKSGFDTSNSIMTMKSSGGITVDLSNKKTQDIPSENVVPPYGEYNYAYIKVSNLIKLKGSYKISQPSTKTYYSKSGGVDKYGEYGVADSSLTAAKEFNNLIKDLGNNEWKGFQPLEKMKDGHFSLLLLKENEEIATSKENAKKIMAVFKFDSPVVINEKTKGLEVQLKVTNAGYLIEWDDDKDDIGYFNSAPFIPVFETF